MNKSDSVYRHGISDAQRIYAIKHSIKVFDDPSDQNSAVILGYTNELRGIPIEVIIDKRTYRPYHAMICRDEWLCYFREEELVYAKQNKTIPREIPSRDEIVARGGLSEIVRTPISIIEQQSRTSVRETPPIDYSRPAVALAPKPSDVTFRRTPPKRFPDYTKVASSTPAINGYEPAD